MNAAGHRETAEERHARHLGIEAAERARPSLDNALFAAFSEPRTLFEAWVATPEGYASRPWRAVVEARARLKRFGRIKVAPQSRDGVRRWVAA